MESLSTKKRILQEALSLFAKKGYEAVSVAEIAGAVGIKAPSLYKHYKSKQDIFDGILAEMAGRYEQQAAGMQLDGSDADRDAGLFMNLGEEELIAMGKNLLLYFLHDEFTCKIRRVLTIEQYNSKLLAEMQVKQYIEAPLAYQERIFGMLIEAGVLKEGNPKIMALQFYSPLHLMLLLCDSQPEREAQALEVLEEHIKEFNRLYRKEPGKDE